MVRVTACLAMALYMAGCAGDTGATLNHSDAFVSEDVRVPPGADSPYPPEDTDPVTEPEEDVEPAPDIPTDPCASWRPKAAAMYRCTYANGYSDICQIALEVGPENKCLVNCDPALYDYVSKVRMRADGQTFDYKTENDKDDTVCSPIQ